MSQPELFSGQAVRKVEFEFLSSNSHGRKGTKVEMGLSEPAYVTFHSRVVPEL